jgi:hypothetical protein
LAWAQLHFPSTSQRITKITIVLKHPPPNFNAPYPDNSPLKRLFMIILFEWLNYSLKLNIIYSFNLIFVGNDYIVLKMRGKKHINPGIFVVLGNNI